MRCEHEHDDGAYVLGALSPAERRAYEGHLATCSFCREAVRDIWNMPDLLSLIDVDEFAKLVDPSLSTLGAPRPDRSVPVPRRAPASRHKSPKAFRVRILSSTAAAILAVLTGTGVLVWSRYDAPASPPAGPAVAMTAVDTGSPVSATLRLASTPGGTRVDMVCSFSKDAAAADTLRLMAVGRGAEREQIGSWHALPGVTFPMPAVTHFTRGNLSRLELVRSNGTVLLSYDVP